MELGSVLVHGECKCGKTTTLLKMLKDKSDCFEVVRVTPLELNGSLLGASEEMLKYVCHVGDRDKIVFVDDLEMLVNPVLISSLGGILQQIRCRVIDGLFQQDSRNHIYILAATSRLDLVHVSLVQTGKLDEFVSFPSLDLEDRLSLLRQLLSVLDLEAELLEQLAIRTQYCLTISDLIHVSEQISKAIQTENRFTPETIFKLISDISVTSQNQQTINVNFGMTGPTCKLSDFGGIDDVIDSLRNCLLNPLKNRETYRKLGIVAPKGILLFGREGSGKTSLAKAIALEAKKEGVVSSVIVLDTTQVVSKIVGKSERNLSDAFESARKFPPCLLIIDQLELIAAKRHISSTNTSGNSMDRMLSTLLIEMDGIVAGRGTGDDQIIVIATCRDPSSLDTAILRPGRLDFQIGIPELSLKSRLEALERIMGRECAGNVCDDVVEYMGEKSEGYTGAELENMWRSSVMEAMRRNVDTLDALSIASVRVSDVL